MRVLLDECLPKKLKFSIDAEIVQTVPEVGWAGKQNGLAFVVLVAPTNDIDDLLPLMPAVNLTLSSIKPGNIEYVR